MFGFSVVWLLLSIALTLIVPPFGIAVFVIGLLMLVGGSVLVTIARISGDIFRQKPVSCNPLAAMTTPAAIAKKAHGAFSYDDYWISAALGVLIISVIAFTFLF